MCSDLLIFFGDLMHMQLSHCQQVCSQVLTTTPLSLHTLPFAPHFFAWRCWPVGLALNAILNRGRSVIAVQSPGHEHGCDSSCQRLLSAAMLALLST